MTVVETVGWILVHFLWQGAAIAAVLRLVVALAKPSRPTLRYALGCGALVLMLVAPAATAARLAQASAAAFDATRKGIPFTPPPPSPPLVDEQERLQGGIGGRLAHTDSHARAGTDGRARADRSEASTSGDDDPKRGVAAAGLRLIAAIGISDDASMLPPPIRAGVTAMMPWLVTAWALGVMLLSVRLAGGWWRTRMLRTRGIDAVPDACQRMATRLMARMRIARPVSFFVSSRVTAPIVFGHVKPVVLVPAAVLAGLSPSQLDAILAHELAHVRRHDYLVNLAQTVIETIFFYHPAVWWVSRQVRESREECCDDIAVAACGDRKEYVEALLGIEQMRLAATVALGATGGSLLARARRLLIDTEREAASPRLTASAIAIAVAGIAMAGISMAATEPALVERASPSLPSATSSTSSTSTTQSSKTDKAAATEEVVQPARPPESVIAAPDQALPFTARRAWAEREAQNRRASRYWLGYSIRPVKGLHPMIYFDRQTTVTSRDGVRFSGHFFSDRANGLRFSGQPLAVANADPTSIKILLLLEGSGDSPRVSRVHASTMPLPFEANGRPIFWIGGADTASSVAAIDGLYAASTEELKKDLIATAGIHDDSPAVVAWLERRVNGSDTDKVRAEAVEALAWHPIVASLAALERAARQDRATEVRREAAEALGDLAMPEAAPVLIAIAKSIDDREVQREAIEALGERSEAAALDALGAIAKEDANVDMQREAVETLGDYKDGRGVALLQDILRTHPRPDVRREAIETLADRAKPAEAIALLRDVMERDTEIDVRREAVERLADIDDPAARALLIEIARTHASEDVRTQAAESLGGVKPSAETVQALRQIAMSDPTRRVRSQAIEALADLPDGQGIDALIAIARDHPDHDTKKEALEALVDSKHPKARKVFEQILSKPSGG
jgi:beta-lactamase regulating signal transducer with metallopeptidase domain/HEAT repeat protein